MYQILSHKPTSGGKGTCHQDWKIKFQSRNPLYGRRKSSPACCPLISSDVHWYVLLCVKKKNLESRFHIKEVKKKLIANTVYKMYTIYIQIKFKVYE